MPEDLHNELGSLGLSGAGQQTLLKLAERGLERTIRTSFVPFLIGTVIIYVLGVAWLSILMGSFTQAIVAGLLPFMLGDLIKLILAALALPAAWKLAK